MGDRLQAVKGMNDILPSQSKLWSFIEYSFIKLIEQYGYSEIRLPIIEKTALFKRSIGDYTDIVEKEMYTFIDLNGESLTLRPEGTAGCVRACLEHGLIHNKQQKLWYMGPMFRHEKPQKGRYRQFYQLGVEAFGFEGIGIELELLAFSYRYFKKLGLESALQLQINSLGSFQERQDYRAKLIDYFKAHYKDLDEDSKRRLEKNPLRILDSKNPTMQPLIKEAPQLFSVLTKASREHFDFLCEGMNALDIPFSINKQLVRGLDYYNHTVFEWVSDKLGAQATLCGGGRYDGLVSQLGGQSVPCFGFSIGMERLILLLEALAIDLNPVQKFTVFLMAGEEALMPSVLLLAENLRSFNPNWKVLVNTTTASFKNQFKKADKSGANLALIVGADEFEKGNVSVKNLRDPLLTQILVKKEDLLTYLSQQYAVEEKHNLGEKHVSL